MNAYIFCCNKCQLWGGGESYDLSKYSYQCYRCHRKEKVMLKKTGIHVKHKGPLTAKMASQLVQEINKELYLNFQKSKKKKEEQVVFV